MTLLRLFVGNAEHIGMAAEEGEPIRRMVKAYHDVSELVQSVRNAVVFANLVRSVVGRAVNVDGGVGLAVVEVGACRNLWNQVLGVAGQAKAQRFHFVEPALLETTVAASAKRSQALRPGTGATRGTALRTRQFREGVSDQLTVEI